MLHFFSLKNPESEETKQCQRAVRLFRLLNLFCCYFFFLLRRTEHCLLHFNIETSSLFIGEQFSSCNFFFWSTTKFITVTAFLLLSLLFVSSEICIFFTLKSMIKHASLITPSSSHTTNTCTFKDFRVLKKTKSKKKKKEWKKFQVFLVLTLIWL